MQSSFAYEPRREVGIPPSKRPGPARRRSYSAPALEKGLDIIELLAASAQPMSTRAVAQRLERSKGEIFRMVFVLVERGYLRRVEATDELVLSNRLFELGMRTPRSRTLIEVAVPAMEQLCDRIGHSAHLVVVNSGETVVIATTAGSADVSFTLRLGYHRSALDATSGRIILAFQDAERRARMIADARMGQRKPFAGRAFLRELDAIAAQGFLIARSHDVVGVTDIGAPVIGRNGRALAAIVVPCLERHGTVPHHERIVARLRETCERIAAALR